MSVTRGRLLGAADAPVTGEHIAEIARLGGVVVEQILSGTVAAPVDFDQERPDNSPT